MKETLATAILLIIPMLATGTTWTVSKDGSCQFVEIQDAINLAATGDTISIGPGRYDEFRPYTYGMEEWNIIVNSDGKALVLIGSGDATIIGPEIVDNLEYSNTIGIHCSNAGNTQIINNIIVENVHTGIMQLGDESIICGITAQECWNGIHTSSYASCSIMDCVLRRCSHLGILLTLIESNSEVIGCSFLENQWGIDIDYFSSDVILRDCTFVDNTSVGIQYATNSTGVIENCQVNGSNTGISVGVSAVVEINNSTSIPMAYWGITVFNSSRIYGTGNIIHGEGTYPAIQCCLSSMDITESHIIRDQGYAVKLYCNYPQGYSLPLDLSANYWGTSDADSIATWIWDGNDDLSMPVTVQYLPFYGNQVSNENTSFGDIKAMFRR